MSLLCSFSSTLFFKVCILCFSKVLCVSSRHRNPAAEANTHKKNPVAFPSVYDWFVLLICYVSYMLLSLHEITCNIIAKHYGIVSILFSLPFYCASK